MSGGTVFIRQAADVVRKRQFILGDSVHMEP
jgi:hypothetical protein